MNRKMIFFDIDGTLMPEGSDIIPGSTKAALALAQQNGHLIFINTGRTAFNVDEHIKALDFDGYVCGCGTHITYRDQTLFTSTIPHDRCIRLVELMRSCNIPGFYEETDHIYFDTDSASPSFEVLAEIRKVFGAKGFDLPADMNDPSFTFDKILAYVREDSDVARFRAYSDDFLEYIDRGGHVAEITQKDCSKATGIQFLCDHLDIPLKDCYAIGDSNNDLSMLEYVPNSIAMGNSSPDVLARCSYVTTDVDKDGIYNALKHFNLI